MTLYFRWNVKISISNFIFMVFDKSKKMKWLKVEKSLKEFCFYSNFYKMDESTASEKVQKVQFWIYKGPQIKSVKEKTRLKLKNKEETASHSTMG